MKYYSKLTICLLAQLLYNTTLAQENTASDSMQLKQMQSFFNTLSKIKFSGYIQAQFQAANAEGAQTYEGGNFAEDVGNRFMVRRGRLKMQHADKISLSVLQIDVTEKGVGIKDAYVTLSDPWINSFGLTVGLFNRPFGFEIPYSSSERESPERGRLSQIIFPGERDLGAMLSFKLPETSFLKFIKLDAGLFNGSGTAQDFENNKDFIGRLRLNEIIKNDAVKFSIAGSYYNGVWRQNNVILYKIGTDVNNVETFIAFPGFGKSKRGAPREYIGGDAQLEIKWIAGKTILRGEYIFGEQSGLANSTTSPSTQPSGNVYLRNFDGAYFYFIQNILNSGHQLVVKYDWYDPNTDVEGNQIGNIFNNLGFAEIKYESLGFGGNFMISNHLKFMAFYQTVKNESTSITPKDIKDDVLTLRLQHKF